MSHKELETKAVDLLEIVIESLKQRIRSGEATASDFKNAIELLKNNGITVDITEEGNLAEDLLNALPFKDEDTPSRELLN